MDQWQDWPNVEWGLQGVPEEASEVVSATKVDVKEEAREVV